MKNDCNTLSGYFRHFIDDELPTRRNNNSGGLITSSSRVQYEICCRHIFDYLKDNGLEEMTFDEIDDRFYADFVRWLESGGPGRKALSANTVGKIIKIFKTVLGAAEDEGVNNNSRYRRFKVITEDTDSIYLDEDELEVLRRLDLSANRGLSQARDAFLLMAWTGCRYSDLQNLNRLERDAEMITVCQKKTGARVVIPLHPVVKEILGRWNGSFSCTISNQRLNERIKEICRLAAIDSPAMRTRTVGGRRRSWVCCKYEMVCSHTARRSFATNMYKRGIPAMTIMAVTGHRSERSFRKYIRISQLEHARIMSDFWQKIYQ